MICNIQGVGGEQLVADAACIGLASDSPATRAVVALVDVNFHFRFDGLAMLGYGWCVVDARVR